MAQNDSSCARPFAFGDLPGSWQRLDVGCVAGLQLCPVPSRQLTKQFGFWIQFSSQCWKILHNIFFSSFGAE